MLHCKQEALLYDVLHGGVTEVGLLDPHLMSRKFRMRERCIHFLLIDGGQLKLCFLRLTTMEASRIERIRDVYALELS